MKRIIFFDGVCTLCNHFVDILIRQDKSHQFYFASLQSKTAEQLLKKQDLSLDTIVFLDQTQTFKKSSAVLRILFHLGGLWMVLSILGSVLPTSLRDVIYDWVARHRYNFFGKKETCRLPTAEEKSFFLD